MINGLERILLSRDLSSFSHLVQLLDLFAGKAHLNSRTRNCDFRLPARGDVWNWVFGAMFVS